MAEDLKTQLGTFWRRAVRGAEELTAEIQRNAPGAIEQIRGRADVAWGTVTRKIEEAARAAEDAGIISGRNAPSDGPQNGASAREVQFGRREVSLDAGVIAGTNVYELGGPETRITVRVTDLGGDTMHAMVAHPLFRPVQMRMARTAEGYCGNGQTDDKTAVRFTIDAEGKCSATFGNSEPATLTSIDDRCEDWRVRFGVNRERELAARLGELSLGSLSDAQRTALASLAGAAVSKRGGSVKLAELIAGKTDLTPAQVAQVPLLNAWVASDESFDPARLTALFSAALQSTRLPAEARALAERVLETSRALPADTHPGVRWAVVLTGVLATASFLERDPAQPTSTFDALLDGARPAMRLMMDGHAGHPECIDMLVRVWTQVTQLMCRSLPVGPVRAALAATIDRARNQPVDVACQTFAAGVADAVRLSRGESKGEPRAGLPELAAYQAVAPVHVRRFDAPLGAETASWQDVAQRETFLDCALATAWIAMVSAQPDIVGRLIRELPGEPRKFAMTAYFQVEDGTMRGEPFQLDDRLYALEDGRPAFGSTRLGEPARPSSLWFALAEKAFAQVRAENPHYASCELCKPTDVWQVMLGTTDIHVMSLQRLNPADVANQLKAARAAGSAIVLGTHHDPERYRGSDLAAGHAYALTDLVERDGKLFVELINPRGERLPIAAGLANDVHLAAVDLDLRYNMENELRGRFELPVERVAAEFNLCYWLGADALRPRDG